MMIQQDRKFLKMSSPSTTQKLSVESTAADFRDSAAAARVGKKQSLESALREEYGLTQA